MVTYSLPRSHLRGLEPRHARGVLLGDHASHTEHRPPAVDDLILGGLAVPWDAEGPLEGGGLVGHARLDDGHAAHIEFDRAEVAEDRRLLVEHQEPVSQLHALRVVGEQLEGQEPELLDLAVAKISSYCWKISGTTAMISQGKDKALITGQGRWGLYVRRPSEMVEYCRQAPLDEKLDTTDLKPEAKREQKKLK